MADNTTLNSGTGGDVLRTDDVGGGVKIPVSKIHTGGDGVDGGAVTSANPFPATLISGSQTGLLVGANPVASTNPLPASTMSGSQTGILVGANPVAVSNPLPSTLISGSQTGLLVGALPVAQSNPLPTRPMSGSQTGILVGANPVAISNPFPSTGMEVATTFMSGSVIGAVYHATGDYASGSANQVVPPAGAGKRIALLSAHVMAPTACTIRWQSTGSAGSITSISGLSPVPANGGYVLPHNPHGWCKTVANEGLNIGINMAGGGTCGVTITWAIFNA